MNMKSVIAALLMVPVIYFTLPLVGAQTREQASRPPATIPGASPQAQTRDFTTKPNRCKKCLEWSLECVKKNDQGVCMQWKNRCLQWETYPC